MVWKGIHTSDRENNIKKRHHHHQEEDNDNKKKKKKNTKTHPIWWFQPIRKKYGSNGMASPLLCMVNMEKSVQPPPGVSFEGFLFPDQTCQDADSISVDAPPNVVARFAGFQRSWRNVFRNSNNPQGKRQKRGKNPGEMMDFGTRHHETQFVSTFGFIWCCLLELL